MAVRLQQNDGMVRDYPVVSPAKQGTLARAKCGAEDCEHLECALGYCRDQVEGMRLVLWAFPVGTVVVVGVLFMTLTDMLKDLGGESLMTALGASAFILAMDIAGFVILRGVLTTSRSDLEELQEFHEHGTVHGIPAKQVLLASSGGNRPGK